MTRRMVYFARRVDGTGPIKIGCSVWPKFRLRQIEIDMRLRLTLLATAPGGYWLEKNVHNLFRHLRELQSVPLPEGRATPIAGLTEWFNPAPELLEFIETVIETGAIPLPDNCVLVEEFVERFNAGETLRAIAADHGLSHERVRQVLNEHGCPTNRNRLAKAA